MGASQPETARYDVTMRTGETEIEMVNRHIETGARIVARQQELVARLKRHDLPFAEAEALLSTFEAVQGEHEAHLARLVAAQP